MLAGFILLVLRALRAILAPSLALVIFNLFLFATSGAAAHCPRSATILPFLEPIVHLNLRTTLLPLLAHATDSSIEVCISSRSSIVNLSA